MANPSTLLEAADLNDDATRLILADAFEEGERWLEAKLLRAVQPTRRWDVQNRGGVVCPRMTDGEAREGDDENPIAAIDCLCGDVHIGGCWVHADPDDETQPWTVQAYPADALLEGSIGVNEEFYEEYGLTLTAEEVDTLSRWVSEESESVCRAAAERYRQELM